MRLNHKGIGQAVSFSGNYIFILDDFPFGRYDLSVRLDGWLVADVGSTWG